MNRLSLPVAALVCGLSGSCLADAHRDLLELDLDTLLTIEISPSADASARGLSAPLRGGQVADGGRTGLLGTRPILTSPFAVTSYTSDFILDQQAASVGDVLQYDSAVRITRGFGNFQQAYRVRGLPIFSDDMAYNGLYGMLPRQYLAAELIERVEVQRGANAFLNGAAPSSSGIGGAVNALPKRAPAKDLTRFVLGTQTGGQHYVATDLARRSDDKRLGLRFNGMQREGDTAVDDESRALAMAAVGGDWRGKTLRISVDLGYQSHRLDATTPSITIASGLGIPDAPAADSAIAPPWTWSDEEDLFGTLRAEYDVSQNVTGWVAGGTRRGEEDSRFAAFLTVNNAAGDFTASRFDVVHEDAVITGETGLRIGFRSGSVSHQLTLSANAYRNEGSNAYAIYDSFDGNLYRPLAMAQPAQVLVAGGDLNRPGVTAITRSTSIAIADELALLDARLLLTLGARQQNIRESAYDYNSGTRLAEYDESILTPALGAVYRFTPQWSVYLNYIEGLLKGDIAPASNNEGAVANAGRSLQPYRAQQLESGVKVSAGTLGATLALFSIRQPVSGYNSDNALVELDHQTNRGVEMSLYGEAAPGLKILGGLSLLDSDRDGRDAIGSPGIQANLNLEWDVPQWHGLALNGQLMYTGTQYADADNRQKVPAWNRLDLGARYRTRLQSANLLVLRARLENLGNRDYWASTGGYPGEGYLTLGGPRSLVVSVSLDY